MAHHQKATARQLEFGDAPPAHPGSATMCVVCGRVPAQLTLKPTPGDHRLRTAPRLCLRCHHTVMQQRRMVRSQLGVRAIAAPSSAPGASLIVPRSAELTGEGKYRQLMQSRRRAQKAARQALGSLDLDPVADAAT